jgi:hypothetical protein
MVLILHILITDTHKGMSHVKNGPPFNLSGPFALLMFAPEAPINSSQYIRFADLPPTK